MSQAELYKIRQEVKEKELVKMRYQWFREYHQHEKCLGCMPQIWNSQKQILLLEKASGFEGKRIAKEILSENNSQNTHYIPVYIKKIVRQEHGVKLLNFALLQTGGRHSSHPEIRAFKKSRPGVLGSALPRTSSVGARGGLGVLRDKDERRLAGVFMPEGTYNPYIKRAG